MAISIDRSLNMTSGTSARKVIRWIILGCLLVTSSAGCQAPGASIQQEKVPPSMERLTECQDVRARALSVLQSGGTLELRTRTEDGSTFESCALELWRSDSKFALRLRKLGERFLWVGSNGEAWWIFELMSEPVRLVVLPSGELGGFSLGPGQGLLNPDRLLHFAGFLPYGQIDEMTLGFDDDGRIRFITTEASKGEWRRTRWHLDPKSLLPVEVIALDEQGEVLASARLSGYEPIAARDLPLGAWPQFPRKIFLSLPDENADVRLFFNRPSARGDSIKPKLFDLEQLMKTFRPGKVEYVTR